MDLSIVIVNWNTRELLARCLKSVFDTTTCGSFEVMVVDNHSSDGSASMVNEDYPYAQLLRSEKNLGFAAANNWAIRQAIGENILLLNPDTIVTDQAIDTLLAVLTADPQIGIVGGQLLNFDGSLQDSWGTFPSLLTEMPFINRLTRRAPRTTEVALGEFGTTAIQYPESVSGASLMIRQSVIDRIGELDEAFWLYTEETDWCFRARQAGWQIGFVPAARIYHYARAASGQRHVFTMLHFYQSRVRFARKHYGLAHALGMKQVLRLKAAIWFRRPSSSPLRGAYANLSDEQIRAAYRTLRKALALPLNEFLASHW